MPRYPLTTILLIAAAASGLQADTKIDNTGGWNGMDNVSPFGPPNTQTYGELVTAPADNVLESWTFYMEQSTDTQFQGYVYAWDPVNNRATGPALFTSSVMSTSDPTIFQPVTFNTGGVDLITGDEYVLFASSSADAQTGGGGLWGFIGSEPENFSYLNNGTDTSQWTSTSWSGLGSGSLAFQADFAPAPVPEPVGVVLFATVLLGCVGSRWRRRNS